MIQRFRAATREIGWSICGEEALVLCVGRASLLEDGYEAEVLLAAGERRMYKTKRKSKLTRASTESTLSLSNALGASTLPFEMIDSEEACELASRPDISLPLGWEPPGV
jgi:hypothetical protein